MGKVISIQLVSRVLDEIKSSGGKIILTGGCFDILHPGHVEFLEKSKKLAGTLVLLLENDQSVKKLKGLDRPIFNQKDRAYVLSKLSVVDYVVLLPYFTQDQEYEELVKKINPDIITITRGDRNISEKRSQARKIGAQLVEIMDRKRGYATTGIVEKLHNL